MTKMGKKRNRQAHLGPLILDLHSSGPKCKSITNLRPRFPKHRTYHDIHMYMASTIGDGEETGERFEVIVAHYIETLRPEPFCWCFWLCSEIYHQALGEGVVGGRWSVSMWARYIPQTDKCPKSACSSTSSAKASRACSAHEEYESTAGSTERNVHSVSKRHHYRVGTEVYTSRVVARR